MDIVFHNILQKYMSTGNPTYWYDMYAWCGLTLLNKITDLKKRKRLYEILKEINKKCIKS